MKRRVLKKRITRADREAGRFAKRLLGAHDRHTVDARLIALCEAVNAMPATIVRIWPPSPCKIVAAVEIDRAARFYAEVVDTAHHPGSE